MVTIYQDYQDEPDDVFLPLPEDLACEFYRLEMEPFSADIAFYNSLLPQRGKILELGCGTGRVAGQIAGQNRYVIGIDLSLAMLRLAQQKKHPNCNYICMDMVRPAFTTKFDSILIPYNTLNLLTSTTKILRCLNGCRNYLQPGGKLLVQIFVPTGDLVKGQHKSFHFQMFDNPKGGKIIKEIIKKYLPETFTIHIEERFRVRPMQQGSANSDWNREYSAAGFGADHWLSIFKTAGFIQTDILGDFDGTPYESTTSSVLIATFTL